MSCFTFQVQENSPALKAGLEPFFDFILSIGNTRLVSKCHIISTEKFYIAWTMIELDWQWIKIEKKNLNNDIYYPTVLKYPSNFPYSSSTNSSVLKYRESVA